MAATWGVRRTGSLGKVIWFELDLSRRGTTRTWDDNTEMDLDALVPRFDVDVDVDDDTAAPRNMGVLRRGRRPARPVCRDAA